MAAAPRLVSVHVLVAEIQKHLFDYRRRARCEETVEHDLLTLLAHFQARRMGLKEFCARLRVLLGAAVLKATVQGLSGQAAGASCSPRAWREDTSKERPARVAAVRRRRTAAKAGARRGEGEEKLSVL